MYYPRRILRGVLLATLLLLFGVSTEAQRAFRRNPGSVLPIDGRQLRPTLGCRTSGITSETPGDLLASKPSLPECDVGMAETAASNSHALASSRLVVPYQEAFGKSGQSILAARAGVLGILDSENGCTEWFRKADGKPASVFRTLTFTLDAKAVDYIIERTKDDKVEAWLNPYVATALQNGGESQVVTLNARGAFFRTSANVIRMAQEGGPFQFSGFRILKVGPYFGNTPQAQLTTMLHELGHLLGLLPFDARDANGQSAANTAEVLRHCQPEIESAAKHPISEH